TRSEILSGEANQRTVCLVSHLQVRIPECLDQLGRVLWTVSTIADDFRRQRANLGIVVGQQHLDIIEGKVIPAFCRRQKQREEKNGGAYLKERLGGGVLPRAHQSQPVDGKADEEQQEKGRPDELQHWREKAGKTTRSQRDDRRSDQQQVEDG